MFRTRAGKVEKVLIAAGYSVSIEKPAVKGSFIVTIGGKKVIECVGMARPFTKLRETDVEEVVKAAI